MCSSLERVFKYVLNIYPFTSKARFWSTVTGTHVCIHVFMVLEFPGIIYILSEQGDLLTKY